MKKYKSTVARVIHESAIDLYKDGIITEARMKEFDQSCLVSTADTAGVSTAKRSPAVAAASAPHGHSAK
ncbi:hypothetical protein FACS1894190_12550 [Spirochaetia bacterium]|nr:hypothetical protein FACS1894190_12550 [Spirochaetia bacterium]